MYRLPSRSRIPAPIKNAGTLLSIIVGVIALAWILSVFIIATAATTIRIKAAARLHQTRNLRNPVR